MNSYHSYYSRCGIPVIIMGETGCGKTRLIRYMCDMAAQRVSGSKEPSPNMLILKVLLSIVPAQWSDGYLLQYSGFA